MNFLDPPKLRGEVKMKEKKGLLIQLLAGLFILSTGIGLLLIHKSLLVGIIFIFWGVGIIILM